MSLAASVKQWVWERSSREKSLETFQVAKSEAMDAAPFSGDDSFVQRKTGEESLQMRICDPVRNPGWDHVVALHRDAGCFHTSAWAKVLHQTYNHQPFYLQFSRGRRLAALVPLMEVRSPFTGRRGVCLPFSDACEPLIFDPEVVGSIRDRLVRFAQERRWKHLEIRGGKSFQLAPSAATKFYGHIHSICAAAAENLAARFASPVRRAIRKAEHSGVSAMVRAQSRRPLAIFTDFMFKHAAVTVFRHNRPHFS